MIDDAIYQFLTMPFDQLETLSRLSFPLSSKEQMVIVRTLNIQFNQKFIVHYRYDKIPESYHFQYRIPRNDMEIRTFLRWIQKNMTDRKIPPSWTESENSHLYKRLLSVQTKRSFDKHDRSQTISEYEKEIALVRSHMESYTPLSSSVLLTGCNKLEIFRGMRTTGKKNQILYLLGEHHEIGGNMLECLHTILNHTKCPVDIIVEASYDASIANSPLGPFFSMSHFKSSVQSNNRTLSRLYTQCRTKGNVPNPSQMTPGSPYFQNCIVPFQGRVKIWSEDYRFSSKFIYLQFLEIDLEEEDYQTEKMRLVHAFYHLFCDFQTFHTQFELYYERLRDFLDEVEEFVKRSFPSIHFEIPPRSKGLRRLLESLRFLPTETIRYWFQSISEQSLLMKLYFPLLFDIPVVLRIMRLFQIQKDRILITLCGFFHVDNLTDLLIQPFYGHNASTDSTLWIKRMDIPTGDHSGMLLPYPPLQSNDTTPNIQVYQKNKTKKETRSGSRVIPKK